jgi:hypothetical protein
MFQSFGDARPTAVFALGLRGEKTLWSVRARLYGHVQPHSPFDQSLRPGGRSKFKVQVFNVRLERETSMFREFSKRRNDARIEEFAHCNEPRVIVGLKQSRLAV